MPTLPNLRRIRLAKMMTQKDLAEAAGVSRVAIARLEAEKASARFSTIKALAKALGVDPSELIE